MANVDNAFGFRPIANIGPIIECVALSGAGAIFIGDSVIPGGSGDADGRMSVVQAAAGNANTVGVVVGILPSGPDSLGTYRGATGAARILQVVPAYPDTHFLVNCSTTLAATDIGTGYDIVVGSGSTTTGRSAMELDVSTAATTGTSLRLIGTQRRPDNDATGTGVDAVVVFAESLFINGAGV